MGLYQQLDYRKALKDILAQRKRVDDSVSFGSYAEAIGVQKTFVSKVLNGSAHLSDDQLYLTLEYLTFPVEETKYFRLLYDYSRTGLSSRKKVLLNQIRKIQEEQRQFKIHTTAEMQKPEFSHEIGEYYLDPLNLIVHAYLGIRKFAQNPSLIATELELPPDQLIKILERLKRSKIIDFDIGGGKVQVLKNALHLDIDSIYNQPHQQIFRLRCLEHVTKLTPEQRFVFSLTFSGSREVKKRIQEMYLDFFKQVETLLDSESSYEDVYQINFDLFPWARRPKE